MNPALFRKWTLYSLLLYSLSGAALFLSSLSWIKTPLYDMERTSTRAVAAISSQILDAEFESITDWTKNISSQVEAQQKATEFFENPKIIGIQIYLKHQMIWQKTNWNNPAEWEHSYKDFPTLSDALFPVKQMGHTHFVRLSSLNDKTPIYQIFTLLPNEIILCTSTLANPIWTHISQSIIDNFGKTSSTFQAWTEEGMVYITNDAFKIIGQSESRYSLNEDASHFSVFTLPTFAQGTPTFALYQESLDGQKWDAYSTTLPKWNLNLISQLPHDSGIIFIRRFALYSFFGIAFFHLMSWLCLQLAFFSWITKPFHSLLLTLARLPKSKYGVRFPHIKHADEFGQTSRAIQLLLDIDLKKIAESAQNNSSKETHKLLAVSEGIKLDLAVAVIRFHNLGEIENAQYWVKNYEQLYSDLSVAITQTHGIMDYSSGDLLCFAWGSLESSPVQIGKDLIAFINLARTAINKINKTLEKQNQPTLTFSAAIDFGPSLLHKFGSVDRPLYSIYGKARESALWLQNFADAYGVDALYTDEIVPMFPPQVPFTKLSSGSESMPVLYTIETEEEAHVTVDSTLAA